MTGNYLYQGIFYTSTECEYFATAGPIFMQSFASVNQKTLYPLLFLVHSCS